MSLTVIRMLPVAVSLLGKNLYLATLAQPSGDKGMITNRLIAKMRWSCF